MLDLTVNVIDETLIVIDRKRHRENTTTDDIDKEAIDLLVSLGMCELLGIMLKEEAPMVLTAIPDAFGGSHGGYGGRSR
ncbi:hypothetical protein QVD17_11786 [Tagetes erecta]|uniref:Uncharacterized protein n=1 Tax=Tagetes erecta TaxID=13708 RepID=A0AAD8P176_TARER|nr:hypothetical protein QVD17_11786 [Tagetes erecta]